MFRGSGEGGKRIFMFLSKKRPSVPKVLARIVVSNELRYGLFSMHVLMHRRIQAFLHIDRPTTKVAHSILSILDRTFKRTPKIQNL